MKRQKETVGQTPSIKKSKTQISRKEGEKATVLVQQKKSSKHERCHS